MKQLLVSLFAIIAMYGQAQEKAIVIDANAQKRNITESFNQITVTDGVDLYLTQSNEESVAVSASEDKYLEKFKTEVVNGTLKIYYDNKGINWSANDRKKLKAYVSFKSLSKLEASGGADVLMDGILSAGDLNLKFSSGAHFKGAVKISALTVEQSSGSLMEVSGNAGNFTIAVNSGAIFKGFDLSTDYCDAKASSGAGIRITINKELTAKANSGGGIKYKGDAAIKNININSGGSVKKS